ncbi:MAG: AAA family ATPase [Roseburia sp.]|nr:AAA family ATPase [Roseburia sp.]
MLKRLTLENWRQYGKVDISFHPHLTILTGANGAGKTTLLNIIAQNLGWNTKFVSSYEKDEKESSLHYSNSLRYTLEQIWALLNTKKLQNHSIKIGEIVYSDGNIGHIKVPEAVSATYQIIIEHQQKIRGLYINSHRPTFPYKPIKAIPATTVGRDVIFSEYYQFARTFVFDEYRNSSELSSTGLIKETLASLAMFGYGNKAVVENTEMKKLFEGYEEILRKVLPSNIGFKNIKVTTPEVILCTETGDFPLDAVSGGISSIIDITWQIFMYDDPSEQFVVVLDEPENHLHPELQKAFLNNLIEVFPNVQFIVATHNPFMISAVKDSFVYVLNYNNEHKVFSTFLDHVNRAGTSDAILRDVLGIDSSIPFWAENKLQSIIANFSQKEFSQESLSLLREELSEIGLAQFIPETIAQVAEVISNDKASQN